MVFMYLLLMHQMGNNVANIKNFSGMNTFRISTNSCLTFAAKIYGIMNWMKLVPAAMMLLCWNAGGQEKSDGLEYYIRAAKENSPLIKDCRNRAEIQDVELQRLDAMYRHSRLEADGEYLFVPVISRDGGQTSFKWNAQNGDDYWGYDLGESSGHLHAGVTWTQPLLGGSRYKAAKEASEITRRIVDNEISLEEHQLERTVTERYILCLLDKIQVSYADSVAELLSRQMLAVGKLVGNGLAKQSDIRLLEIEIDSNDEYREAMLQDGRSHLADLNLICGVGSAEGLNIADISVVETSFLADGSSRFDEKFRLDSLDAAMSLKTYRLQYLPHLDLFAGGGMQTGAFRGWYRHFGVSAGLSFSWTIFDGRQRRLKERQTRLQQQTINAYRENFGHQRNTHIQQCLEELAGFDRRESAMERQIEEYDAVLSAYEKEIAAGQVSVLDYITVLRRLIQARRDYMLLKTNRQLAVVAYNYWNW